MGSTQALTLVLSPSWPLALWVSHVMNLNFNPEHPDRCIFPDAITMPGTIHGQHTGSIPSPGWAGGFGVSLASLPIPRRLPALSSPASKHSCPPSLKPRWLRSGGDASTCCLGGLSAQHLWSHFLTSLCKLLLSCLQGLPPPAQVLCSFSLGSQLFQHPRSSLWAVPSLLSPATSILVGLKPANTL